jgi:molybdopterin-containing oxidoreductase family iron-sulfur binding subunit
MSSPDRHINFKLMRDRILAHEKGESVGAPSKNGQGKQFWRSLDELADSPEFNELVLREFPSQADEWNDPVERRTFLKVMGASLALAGLSGCVYQPPESIVPYVNQPEAIVPGKALYFATSMSLNGVAMGLLARSNEGRPTKIEGNPEHPGSLGATDVFAQAALLGMYDPDRSQMVIKQAEASSWDRFLGEMREAMKPQGEAGADGANKGGDGLRFLTETVTSPTLAKQFRDIQAKYPKAKWYQYDPINRDNVQQAFTAPVNIYYEFDKADRVVSLDGDFLSNQSRNVRFARDFMRRRRVEHQESNRLYVVESNSTLTGAKADHRWGVKPSEVEGFTRALAKALGVDAGTFKYDAHGPEIAAIAKDISQTRGTSIIIAGDEQSPAVHALVHLMNDKLGNVGTTVHYTEALEAKTSADPAAPPQTQLAGLRELVTDMNAGKVELLVMVGGNPVFNAPPDLNFLAALEKVRTRVHLSLYMDETSEHCHWHVPAAHFLESWGDGLAYDGTVTFTQPLIEPLYTGKTANEFISAFAPSGFDTGYNLVQGYWKTAWNRPAGTAPTVAPAPAATPAATPAPTPAATPAPSPAAVAHEPATAAAPAAHTTASSEESGAAVPNRPATTDFDTWWRRVVHDGFVDKSRLPDKAPSVNTSVIGQVAAASAPDQMEIVFRGDSSLFDGRFANNGWLQELPKPLTKISWGNAVLISPRTAKTLKITGVKDFEGGSVGGLGGGWRGGNNVAALVKIDYNGLSLSGLPVWILPGQPDNVATINLGYGRTRAGNVGGTTVENAVGFNAYALRHSNAPWGGPATIAQVEGEFEIASTQLHFNMEGRDEAIVRSYDTREAFEKVLEKDKEEHEAFDDSKNVQNENIYAPGQSTVFPYNDYKWGMAIDLNSCTGCNACVIACQSENNIPVVGKEQVMRSREMLWLRIDTYFSSEGEEEGATPDPNKVTGTHFMPTPCMQCENAPCEPVCPVHATVHSAEGLNDMVYNRCVGTRYCSNNCPYKVRHFNFFLYQDWNTPTYQLMRNPEVSVRSRGVMEKCTYCVQRIQAGKIEAEKDGDRKVRDGEIVTACQSVCPTEAIVFGDINDTTSKVRKLKDMEQNYSVMADLNTQPRTTYLAEIRNKNQEIAKA